MDRIYAQVDKDGGLSAFDQVAVDDYRGNRYLVAVQSGSVGRPQVFKPPLPMMMGQARMAHGDRIIGQGQVAMGITS